MKTNDQAARVPGVPEGAHGDLPQPASGNRLTLAKPWWVTAQPILSWWDRVCLLVGVPLYVRFTSPDGECHAACYLSVVVQRDWPANTGQILGGWPPLYKPLPGPPDAPPPPPWWKDPGR